MYLHELTGFAENFLESQNYRAPNSKWVPAKSGNGIERSLDIEGLTYIVSIEPKIFSFEGKNVDFLNLAFVYIDENGKRITTVTDKNILSSSVVGGCFNAFMDKISDFNYSALTFIAFDRIDRRISLYGRIVTSNLHALGGSYLPSVELDNGGKAIIIFKDLSKDTETAFIEWLKKQSKF
jgi:hypothetical protein